MNFRLGLVLSSLIFTVPVAATEFRIADRDTQALTDALVAANNNGQHNTIHLAEHGLYTLTAPSGPDQAFGLPPISGKLDLRGHGAEIRRYAPSGFTLLAVTRSGAVSLSDLTLAEGNEGAIRNHGTLHLQRVQIVDNVARHSAAIVENYGELSISDSEIAFNQMAGRERDAGTILNYGQLRIHRSRIAENFISRRFDSLYAASAVLNFGKLRLSGVRIEDNVAESVLIQSALGAVVNLGVGDIHSEALVARNNEPADADLIDSDTH